MKCLVNCANLYATGANQVAHSFINEIAKMRNMTFVIACNQMNFDNLKQFESPGQVDVILISKASRGMIRHLKVIKGLQGIESKNNFNVAFTVFGPTFWKPKVPHMIGYAYPQFIYSESPFLMNQGIMKKLLTYLKKKFCMCLLRNTANIIVCETEDVEVKLHELISSFQGEIVTVSNSVNGVFKKYSDHSKKDASDVFTMLYPASKSTHKNHRVIPEIIDYLKVYRPDFKFKFILTVEASDFDWLSDDGFREYVECKGRVSIEDVPSLYLEADVLFHPSLLECFSASYAEAMYMGIPILASNLDFAKTVCNDAALYFDPLSVDDIVESIIALSKDKFLYNSLKRIGRQRLHSFDDSSSRAIKYLQLMQTIAV